MKIRQKLFLGLMLSFLGAVSVIAQRQSVSVPSNSRVVALRATRMIDVKAGAPVNNVVILIESGRITSVGPNLAIPAGAQVIDLGQSTVLPGLIDTHTHLLSNFKHAYGSGDINMLLTLTQMSTAKGALMGAALGREDLEAGITTVRDLGNAGMNGDVALRDAINADWVVGPRMQVSTRALSAAGGQFGPTAKDVKASLILNM